MGGVGGPERRQNILSVCAERGRVGDEQRPDLPAERLTADGVGERCQRIGAHARALDERGDHGLPRERRAAEHAGVEHRRVDRVGADQRPALADRHARGGGEVVDRLGHALRIDREGRAQVGREPVQEARVLGGGVGQQRFDAATVTALHVAPFRPRPASRARGAGCEAAC